MLLSGNLGASSLAGRACRNCSSWLEPWDLMSLRSDMGVWELCPQPPAQKSYKLRIAVISPEPFWGASQAASCPLCPASPGALGRTWSIASSHLGLSPHICGVCPMAISASFSLCVHPIISLPLGLILSLCLCLSFSFLLSIPLPLPPSASASAGSVWVSLPPEILSISLVLSLWLWYSVRLGLTLTL